MKRKILMLTVLGSLLSPAVNAAVTSSSVLSDVTFSLLDLNPNDGIVPSITFASDLSNFETSSLLIRSFVYDQASGNTIDEKHLNKFGSGDFPFDSDSIFLSYLGGNVYASVTGGGGLLGGHTLATGGEAAPAGGTNTVYTSSVLAPVNRGTQFLLSPYTLLILTGTANLYASSTIGLDVPTGRVEEASASALLSLRGVGSSGSPASTQSSNDPIGVSASYTQDLIGTDPITGLQTYQINPQNLTLTRQLSVSFLNNSSAVISGSVRTEVHSSGYSSLSPVPEPQSLALLAGGTLIAAWAGLNRRSASLR